MTHAIFRQEYSAGNKRGQTYQEELSVSREIPGPRCNVNYKFGGSVGGAISWVGTDGPVATVSPPCWIEEILSRSVFIYDSCLDEKY